MNPTPPAPTPLPPRPLVQAINDLLLIKGAMYVTAEQIEEVVRPYLSAPLPPDSVPEWAVAAAREDIRWFGKPCQFGDYNEAVKRKAEVIARHAPSSPTAVAASNTEALRDLLGEIRDVLKERAVGHAIMYSDRVAGFIKRIDAALSTPPPLPAQADRGERKLAHALKQLFNGGPFDLQDSPQSFMSNVKRLVADFAATPTHHQPDAAGGGEEFMNLQEPTAEEMMPFVWRDARAHAWSCAAAKKNPDHCSFCWEPKHPTSTEKCGMKYPLSGEQLAETYLK